MPPTTDVDAARRNPVGTHVKVGPGLVKGTLAEVVRDLAVLA